MKEGRWKGGREGGGGMMFICDNCLLTNSSLPSLCSMQKTPKARPGIDALLVSYWVVVVPQNVSLWNMLAQEVSILEGCPHFRGQMWYLGIAIVLFIKVSLFQGVLLRGIFNLSVLVHDSISSFSHSVA